MVGSSTSARRRLDFASDGRGGFGAYHDLYNGGSTASELGSPFSASVIAHRFPGLLLFERRIAGVIHHRDQARTRRDGFDHFNIQVLRTGRMMAGAPGEERVLRPGEVVVFDASIPQRTVVERAEYVVLSLPRDTVEAALPGARHLHGTVLPRRAAGLLGDFVFSLARHAEALSPGRAARGGAMLADLLAGAAGDGEVEGMGDGHEDALALHRARADAYIDAHLTDPSLSADGIAAALGLSRSTLYRAFAPVDGVARRITARRLGRLRAALRRPGENRSNAALAFALGFKDESHCSRAFKAAYGVRPGHFRLAARGLREARDGDASALAFRDWFEELR